MAIARALVTQPAIILADEPTGNLDTRSSIEVMAIFQKVHNEGNTVLIITHEPDIVQYTRRMIYFRDGKVEEDEMVKDTKDAAADVQKMSAAI